MAVHPGVLTVSFTSAVAAVVLLGALRAAGMSGLAATGLALLGWLVTLVGLSAAIDWIRRPRERGD